jgi:hypothetical protein
VRQGKGSHEIWQSNLSAKRFSVPVTVKKENPIALVRQPCLPCGFMRLP